MSEQEISDQTTAEKSPAEQAGPKCALLRNAEKQEGDRNCRGRGIKKGIGILLLISLGFFAGRFTGHPPLGFGPFFGPFSESRALDSAMLHKMLSRRLDHLLSEANATELQKSMVNELLLQSVDQSIPLIEKLSKNRTRLAELIGSAQLDKEEIEAVRADEVHVVDELSQVVVHLMVGVTQSLTPAQRKTLAEKLGTH